MLILDLRMLNIISVSEQLYSSKYRFLYELVQNANDWRYERCLQNGKAPCLRFRITPKKFIFETNEDGFTRANVAAICGTSKSSKKASAIAQNIGEKGFGFKYVCRIAQEVRVQSGVWSFAFKYKAMMASEW
ncbi:hypothetical protein DM02DRAFT_652431 [Periconia macrospinosa]|uniref:Histidine kinase/HSP90-like ATPase domain-containing protein n=1 Tax=Periconia macrospinosa TaxID=97972 RepID=A0A2V1E393_9PLEO|nr:hypothetical protein DM02DRAFT_652431 [Periconia macrospinosa]